MWPDLDPVLALDLGRDAPDRRVHGPSVGHRERPHVQVHRLCQPGALEQPRVVGVVPVGQHGGHQVIAVDQNPALVVGREVHRAHHAVAAAGAQPLLGGRQECVCHLGIVLALEEAEQPPLVMLELVEVAVDLRRDPTDGRLAPPGQEELDLGVLEEWIAPSVEEPLAVEQQRRYPVGLVTIQPPRQLDESVQIALARDRADLQGPTSRQGHVYCHLTRNVICPPR